jgi:hypothetical protein
MQVRQLHLQVEKYDSEDWPQEGYHDFLKWLMATVDSVPKEYAQSTMICIDAERGADGDESAYPVIEITYNRPETATEEAERHVEEKLAHERKVRKDRDDLARLKAQYENVSESLPETVFVPERVEDKCD